MYRFVPEQIHSNRYASNPCARAFLLSRLGQCRIPVPFLRFRRKTRFVHIGTNGTNRENEDESVLQAEFANFATVAYSSFSARCTKHVIAVLIWCVCLLSVHVRSSLLYPSGVTDESGIDQPVLIGRTKPLARK